MATLTLTRDLVLGKIGVSLPQHRRNERMSVVIKRITLGQVRSAHRMAIMKMGRDRMNGDVWYRDDHNRPICVLGHIFAEMGLDVSKISDQLNGQTIGGLDGEIIMVLMGVQLTGQSRNYLINLQEMTDAETSWGAAYNELNEEPV